MKIRLLPAMVSLIFMTVPISSAATMIDFQPTQMGYYWYQKSTWLGGSSTDDGFSYSDGSGMVHVQRDYQFYGGSSRSWKEKRLYFQVDLTSVPSSFEGTAVLAFYVTLNNTPGTPSSLYHLATQGTTPTGDAIQQLAGDTVVASTAAFVPGWNFIDLGTAIESDLAKGYSYSVFSIPTFAQTQDVNRLLSLYGPTSTTEIEGASTRPYVTLTPVPEPTTGVLLLAAAAGCGILRRKRRA
ncbi:PEP-CTERM sorting domain-containing protein [Haloferula sp. A504]|uniref:PEP-CTERM sorting domain-containing protein n=1 Tax=Haloferula sp. A504 TaxID=3373601 RepID=UPI0031C5B894|nr:PEP-CTERM sorting domain-containing protein [Verrucomicrobiaceae bacterium E54]